MSNGSNYVQSPGTVNVYPGGGGAPNPLAPTGANQTLQSTVVNGKISVAWAAVQGSVTTGAAATKGQFTLASGTLASPIATTAVNSNSVIAYTVVTLGTVTVASAFKTTISSGVSFTPVASQNTDSSTVNWAIVA